VNPRSEPLLWLQLIGLGAIPLVLLLLLLVLAGADPGPLPGLERFLAWGLGALAPTVLLWQRPADFCSLLVARVPLEARSVQQRHLAALQNAMPAKLLLVLGSAALLPLLWTLDRHAALAAPLSPFGDISRLVSLLLTIPLLALLIWHWQQLVQSLWLLSRPTGVLEAASPLSQERLAAERLCLGMPLLLLEPLTLAPSPPPPASPPPVSSAGGEAVAVESQQGTATDQGSDLNQQID
jgi:hypothetical protein